MGKVWAPLFHAYSYYLPKAPIPAQLVPRVDDQLTTASIENLQHALLNMALLAPLGTNRVIFNILGGLLFAEAESAFALWDGHVSFGSSHTMGHTWGFGLVSIIIKIWKSSVLKNKLPLILLIPFIGFAFSGIDFFLWNWRKDGFHVTQQGEFKPDYEFGDLHRIDNLAHIGGIVAGAITAVLTSKTNIVKESFAYTGIIVGLLASVYLWTGQQRNLALKDFVKQHENYSPEDLIKLSQSRRSRTPWLSQ